MYYAYAADQPIGAFSTDPSVAPDIDYNYTPVSSNYPATSPSLYVVQYGDTLQQIALNVYGDANLWYLIADANGLTQTGSELIQSAGISLRIPNRITNLRNAADTFQPYNPGEVVGDTTPTLTYNAPPPPKKKCGGFLQIIIIAVAVVATVYTAGAAAGMLGASTTAASTVGGTLVASGTAASGLGAWAAGGLALSGSMGMAGAAAAVVGGAVGSIAGQLTGMALGVQDKFSWSQVAVGGLTAAAMAGIGAGLNEITAAGGFGKDAAAALKAGKKIQGWAGAARGAIQGSLGSVANQSLNQMFGLQDHFSWSQVAASTLTSSLGQGLGDQDPLNWIPGGGEGGIGGMLADGLKGTAYGMLNRSIVVALDGRGKIDFKNIAADAFGNAIGNGIVSSMRPKPEGTLRMTGEKPQYNLGSKDGGYNFASGDATMLGAGYDTSFDPLPEIAGPSPFVGEGGIFGGGDPFSAGHMLASAPYDEPVISASRGGGYMVADSGGTMSDAITDSDFREAVARQREQARRDLTGGAEMRAVDLYADRQRVRDFIQGMTGALSVPAGWSGGVAKMSGASDETIFKATMLGADLGMAASPFLATRFGMLTGGGRISLSPVQISTAGETAAGVGKYFRRKDIYSRPAAEVNETFPSDWSPPYKPGTTVTEFTSTVDDAYVRVHRENNMARSWMMKREAIEGLTPEQIKSKYALPELPTHVSEVYVPAGTRIRSGTANSVFGGTGNATQYELLQRLPTSAFKNTVKLNQ